jgi:predicted permease
MRWADKLRLRWRSLIRQPQIDAELQEELRFHLDQQLAENLAAGLTPEEARYAARRSIGGLAQVQEECRDMRRVNLIQNVLQDLRYATRMLRKSSGFTTVAVLSLALGIGANTAVFSVIHAVLLRSLPYPDSGRLVRVARQYTHEGAVIGYLSVPQMEFWKENSRAFESLAGCRGGGTRNLVSVAGREWISTMAVTADFFRALGVNPVLGREFRTEETRLGGPQAIVLTDGLWRRQFRADPSVIGRAVTLDSESHTVVGVLPPGFWFPEKRDAFLPLRPNGGIGDTGLNTQVIARIKPELNLRQAQAEMATVFESYSRRYPDQVTRDERGVALIPYQDSLVGDVRLNLLFLFGAVGVLLLIACSNLASLLLARLAARQKEIALRLALGCSRGRLLGQFLVENLLVSFIGGLAGLLAAFWLLQAFVALIPFDLPASAPIRLDLPVLAFTLVIAVGTGLAFSLVPVLSSVRLDIQAALKAVGRSTTAGPARQRARSMLVTGEVALSAVLLIVAGLLMQSLYRMHQERLGFTPQGLITFETPFASEGHRGDTELASFVRTLSERIQSLPGVQSVAAINVLPLDGQNNIPVQRAGHPEQSIGGMEYRMITPSYFEAMGIPLRRGRFFTADDAGSAPSVVLINETLARRWFPQVNPVGDRIVVGRFEQQEFPEIIEPPREIVGVVADTKGPELKAPARPTIYVPVAQARGSNGLSWVVRAGLSAGLAQQLRRAVADIDSTQRVIRMQPMTEIVASTTADSRFDAWLLAIFAGVALALSAIGIYGMVSFSVAQRRHEIGTRMALGASRGDILGMVIRQGVTLLAIGLVLGIAGALAVARSLASLLYGVRPSDPVSIVTVSLILLSVGLVASYLPARRASRVDPMVALRYE